MRNIIALAFLVLFSAPFARAEDEAQLKKRLDALEKRISLQEAEGPGDDRTVLSYLRTNITLGGFFETALTGIAQPRGDSQLASSSNVFGLNLGAEFNENLRFVSQLFSYVTLPLTNQHSDPRAVAVGQPASREFKTYTVGTFITQGYLEWSKSDAFSLQGGMGYAPYGITFQQLELVLFVRRGGPQLLRTNSLVFPVWQGLHIHGALPWLKGRTGYNLYTFSPQTNPKMLGLGSRAWWRSGGGELHLGLSSQTASRGSATYTSAGPDFRVHFPGWTVFGELAKSFGPGERIWSAHLEPELEFFGQSVLLYAFGDYLEDPLNETGGAFRDPIMKWEYGSGINWLPTSYTRLRLGLAYNDYVGSNSSPLGKNRDYWMADLSAGVAF